MAGRGLPPGFCWFDQSCTPGQLFLLAPNPTYPPGGQIRVKMGTMLIQVRVKTMADDARPPVEKPKKKIPDGRHEGGGDRR